MAKREYLQFDAGRAVRDRLKVVAYSNGMTMREFVLKTLAKEDPELKALIEKELSGSETK
jgi:hypothetical protein